MCAEAHGEKAFNWVRHAAELHTAQVLQPAPCKWGRALYNASEVQDSHEKSDPCIFNQRTWDIEFRTWHYITESLACKLQIIQSHNTYWYPCTAHTNAEGVHQKSDACT